MAKELAAPVDEDMEFNDAFDMAVGDEDLVIDDPAPEVPEIPEVQVAPEPVAEEIALEADEVVPVDNPVETIDEPVVPVDKVAAPAIKVPAPEPIPVQPIFSVDIPEAVTLNEEEQALVDSYKKDWPDHAAATELLLLNQKRALLSEVLPYFNQMAERIQPISEAVKASDHDKFLATIHQVHPDANTLFANGTMSAWIDTLPSGVLKKAYSATLNEGTAAEVIEVFDAYRAANPAAKPAVVPAADPALEEELMRQVDVSASSSPTPKSVGVDKNDFSGAFKEATA